jgi:hypothetical protein
LVTFVDGHGLRLLVALAALLAGRGTQLGLVPSAQLMLGLRIMGSEHLLGDPLGSRDQSRESDAEHGDP